MPVPAVTCGPDQVLNYDGSPRTINLTAAATEAPTAYQWTMLDIPPGSSADVGVNGDFNNGVANVQNPSFDIDGAIDGTYVMQCRATNASGQSNPASDKEGGQTAIVVRTPDTLITIPSDFQYNWGRTYLNPTLRLLESESAKLKVSANDTTRNHLLSKLSAGSGITLTEVNDGANEQVQIAAPGSTTDEKTKVTSSDTTSDYLDSKIAAANGLTKSTLNPAANEQLQLEPSYGTLANTVCEGNDSRLSDARTPLAHATSHQNGGGDEISVAGLSGLLADDQNANAIRTTTGPTLLTVGAVADGEVLTRSGATIVGSTPGGGGFAAREEEFTAAGGTETFTLAATAAVNANMLSGRNILGVFRNGMRNRYRATATTALEWDLPAGNQVRIPSLTASDIITVVYGD